MGVFCIHLEGPKSHIRKKSIIPVLLYFLPIDPFKVGIARSTVIEVDVHDLRSKRLSGLVEPGEECSEQASGHIHARTIPPNHVQRMIPGKDPKYMVCVPPSPKTLIPEKCVC